SGIFDFGSTRWIGIDPAALNHAGGGEYLRTMADGRDGLVAVGELSDQLDDPRIHSKILRGPSAGNRERVVVPFSDVPKRRVQDEVVSGLFRVRRITSESVCGGI